MKRLHRFLTSVILLLATAGQLPAGTVTGQVQNAQSGPLANGTLSFTLTQPAVVSGSATVAPMTVNCFTDANGNVVGEPNPLVSPALSASLGVGTLPAGTYFVKLTYVDATGETVASPEASINLSSQGTLVVTAPVVQPAGVTSYKVYISGASGTETLQGSVTVPPWGNFSQSSALVVGAALPATNTTACKLRFNDELQPSFVCYNTGLITQGGVTVPGYPQYWYMTGGSGGSINVGVGTPQSNVCQGQGVVYPQAIVTTPAAGAQQSINGPLTLNGFTLTAGAINSCSVNGQLVVGSSCYPTIAAAYAACPTAPAACDILIPSNQVLTAVPGLSITGSQQPITFHGYGSDRNGLGGTKITYAPTSVPATAFYGTGTASRINFDNISILQQAAPLTSIVGNGATCTATASGNHGLASTNNIVVFGGNQISIIGLQQNITVTGPQTFTFACTLNGTSSGNGLQVSLAGPGVSITQIAGNGTTATATLGATCPFATGQTVIITGNSSGSGLTYLSFNGPAKLASCSGTSMTFVSAINATITGGTAYVGVNGVLQEGAQGSVISRSVISNFSGVGYGIASSAASNGNANNCENSWSWFNAVNYALYDTVSGGVKNTNKAYGCVFSHATVLPFVCSGICSENELHQTEVTAATSPLIQLGDGASVDRDNIIETTTMEIGVEGAPSSQIGLMNSANATRILVEGALTGAGSPLVNVDTTGASHYGSVGASTAPASNGLSGTGIRYEFNMPNIKLDGNGNFALGGAVIQSGTPPAFSMPTGSFWCAGSACRFTINTDGLRGTSGNASHIGTVAVPITDVSISSNFAFAQTLVSTPTANRTSTFSDATGTVLVTGSGDGTHTTPLQTRRVSGCATGAAQFNTCDTTVTWTTPFADANYTVTCTGDVVTSGVPQVEGVNISAAKLAASSTVRTIALTAAAAQFTTIDCTAIHD